MRHRRLSIIYHAYHHAGLPPCKLTALKSHRTPGWHHHTTKKDLLWVWLQFGSAKDRRLCDSNQNSLLRTMTDELSDPKDSNVKRSKGPPSAWLSTTMGLLSHHILLHDKTHDHDTCLRLRQRRTHFSSYSCCG